MKNERNAQGSIMITVLLVISVMAMMVGVVGLDSLLNLRNVGSNSREKQAKYAAYAGLQSTMNELGKAERNYAETDPRHFYNGDGTTIGPNTGIHEGTLANRPELSFRVEITNNMMGTDPNSPLIAATTSQQVFPGTVYMLAHGLNNENGTTVTLGSMVGLARKVRPYFDDGAYARHNLWMSGVYVDAWDPYDSNDGGDYDSGHGGGPNSPPSSGNKKDLEATVGGDGTKSQAIRLTGDSELDGQIEMSPLAGNDGAIPLTGGGTTSTSAATRGGPAIDPVVVVPDQTDILHTDKVVIEDAVSEVPKFRSPYHDDDAVQNVIVNNSTNPPPPPPKNPPKNWSSSPPDFALDPNGYASIEVSPGQTLRLRSGNYYFKDLMQIEGANIELDIHGGKPVTIFVGKKAVIRNSDVNVGWGDRAVELQFCFCDNEKNRANILAEMQQMWGTGDEYTAYANQLNGIIDPNDMPGFSFFDFSNSNIQAATVGRKAVGQVSGGEYFGALMGHDIKLNNMDLHQDLSLAGTDLMAAGNWALEGVHEVKQ